MNNNVNRRDWLCRSFLLTLMLFRLPDNPIRYPIERYRTNAFLEGRFLI
ncbi:MAG TPA: hypothetical protein VN131_04125 [Mobilitalea sp.]|nr:hypothetical protein [Mobilitalea sp.]